MKVKYFILIPIITLEIISLFYLPPNLQIKQLIWFVLSDISYLILIKFPKKIFKNITYPLYFFSIFLLLIVLFLNHYTNGSRGWLNFGFISFQPSELMKIALLLLFIKHNQNKIKIKYTILYLVIPSILTYLEPDTGSIIMYFLLFLPFFWAQEHQKKYFKYFILFLILLLTILFLIYLKSPQIYVKILGPSIIYRLERLTNYQDNLQTTNALISIASNHLLYFPESYNDFIFATIISQNIYLFPIILLSYFLILILIIKRKQLSSLSYFTCFLFQITWNICMNMQILPVIGIPLPFLSYGGSHTITSLILLSII